MIGSKITTAGLVIALTLTAAPVLAAVSPFRAMAGTWSGGGILTMVNGEQERLRCRASYGVAGRGEELNLHLRCASASYNFDLTGDLLDRGGSITGDWTEMSRNASGTISGRVVADHVEAAARGPNFAANLSMTTRGNRETVSIRPDGTDVRAVSLVLDRR